MTKKPYTHYYENIVVSKSSGVKKKLRERADEMGMSFTDLLDHLLLLEECFRSDGKII